MDVSPYMRNMNATNSTPICYTLAWIREGIQNAAYEFVK
jgi:hypothetical protein